MKLRERTFLQVGIRKKKTDIDELNQSNLNGEESNFSFRDGQNEIGNDPLGNTSYDDSSSIFGDNQNIK